MLPYRILTLLLIVAVPPLVVTFKSQNPGVVAAGMRILPCIVAGVTDVTVVTISALPALARLTVVIPGWKLPPRIE